MKATPAQAKVLDLLAFGFRMKNDALHGPYIEWTRAHPVYGYPWSKVFWPGRTTVRAMVKRGWIDGNYDITDAGREVAA